MCVTEVYVDRYPDGRETGCQQFQPCQYGRPGQPCAKHSTNKNPVRSIGFGEPTTEYILATAARNRQEHFPITPPRSSGGSHHRTGSHASYASSRSDGSHRSSKRRSGISMKPTREHRRERIVIVESPPTPRTPPQPYTQTFTAPSSPATPPYAGDELPPRERGRPIIVDERQTYRTQAPSSGGAIIGERPRHGSPVRKNWDSPSSSHTSIDLSRIREQERAEAQAQAQARAEQDRRDREHDSKMANMEASIRLQEKIKQRDAEIRNRPAVPIAPLRSIMKTKPVVDQSASGLSHMMGKMSISEADLKLREEAEIRKRLDQRDRELKVSREMERDRREEDAMAQRLRERQLPGRRFSVGPGGRRTRVVYDDGVYRWE